MFNESIVRIKYARSTIGYSEAVVGFDGIQPGLFDWKAKTGVIKSNQGANAGQIKAARIEGSTRSLGSQSNSLGCTIEVVYRAGSPGSAGG